MCPLLLYVCSILLRLSQSLSSNSKFKIVLLTRRTYLSRVRPPPSFVFLFFPFFSFPHQILLYTHYQPPPPTPPPPTTTTTATTTTTTTTTTTIHPLPPLPFTSSHTHTFPHTHTLFLTTSSLHTSKPPLYSRTHTKLVSCLRSFSSSFKSSLALVLVHFLSPFLLCVFLHRVSLAFTSSSPIQPSFQKCFPCEFGVCPRT